MPSLKFGNKTVRIPDEYILEDDQAIVTKDHFIIFGAGYYPYYVINNINTNCIGFYAKSLQKDGFCYVLKEYNRHAQIEETEYIKAENAAQVDAIARQLPHFANEAFAAQNGFLLIIHPHATVIPRNIITIGAWGEPLTTYFDIEIGTPTERFIGKDIYDIRKNSVKLSTCFLWVRKGREILPDNKNVMRKKTIPMNPLFSTPLPLP